MKEPWVEYPEFWKTQSAFFSWVRGGIRRGLWEKNPIKLSFIKERRVMIPNPNPKGKKPEVWGGRCEVCNGVFTQKDLQVDHKTGGHSLKSMDDLLPFFKGIVLVSKDDLQMICKGCHTIKSYADKESISFEEARLQKEVIHLSKQPIKAIEAFLAHNGHSGSPKNAKQRREAIEAVLRKRTQEIQ